MQSSTVSIIYCQPPHGAFGAGVTQESALGATQVSPGCPIASGQHCMAHRMAHRTTGVPAIPCVPLHRVTRGTQHYLTAGTQHYLTRGTQHYLTRGTQHYLKEGRQHYLTEGTQHYLTPGRQHYLTEEMHQTSREKRRLKQAGASGT